MTITEMLAALFSSGMSQSAIAKKAGVSQPTIYRASKGAALSYHAGKIIEALYLEQHFPASPPLSPTAAQAFLKAKAAKLRVIEKELIHE